MSNSKDNKFSYKVNIAFNFYVCLFILSNNGTSKGARFRSAPNFKHN